MQVGETETSDPQNRGKASADRLSALPIEWTILDVCRRSHRCAYAMSSLDELAIANVGALLARYIQVRLRPSMVVPEGERAVLDQQL